MIGDDKATEEGAAYTARGTTENVFASLVVLLGYTHLFTRTSNGGKTPATRSEKT